MKIVIMLAAIVTLLAWLPALAVAIAYATATAAGCRLDEGSAHPCIIAGIDVGGLLYTMQVLGWLFIATIPVAVLSVLFWVGLGLYAIIRGMRAG